LRLLRRIGCGDGWCVEEAGDGDWAGSAGLQATGGGRGAHAGTIRAGPAAGGAVGDGKQRPQDKNILATRGVSNGVMKRSVVIADIGRFR
jgi:hypothetical protein